MTEKQVSILAAAIDRQAEAIKEQSKTIGELQVVVASMSTKMSIIVGPDGNNGTLGKLGDRVSILEKSQVRTSTIFGITGVVIGAALKAGLAWAMGKH